jgi:negative regulator of flagellin synthesis FlgM
VPGKIGVFTGSPPESLAAGSAGQRAASTPSPAAGGASVTASVQITDTANHMVTAEQGLNDVPVVNGQRVAQVRDSLASGGYEISAVKVANQLLQFERLLPEDPAS